MEIISTANEGVLNILKRFRRTASGGRLMKYVTQLPTEDGLLLHNLLTRELVHLTPEEAEHMLDSAQLQERWFVVPQDTNERELADMVRWVLEVRQPKKEHITSYTIFTTTDCNARCFYCYEMGRSRIPMSMETAEKVVRYIKRHCGGEKVKLLWFGGEPLFNRDVIDTICNGLRREGVEFHSTMISNGYLFDEESVRKAVENWNLKRVQISLDGTEAVYNRSKAYIYREGSPYQVVLSNMERLLDATIRISVRLNADLYNVDNLMELVEELSRRFRGREGLSVYAHVLFEKNEAMVDIHTQEGWQKREEAMARLWDQIRACGLENKGGVGKSLRMNHCMADAPSSVTILPTGDIGVCEHFSENEFIGHIDREGFDQEMINSWKERMPPIPECDDCFCYPVCLKLKKCPTGGCCFDHLRREMLRKTQQQMLHEYRRWLAKAEAEEFEDELC